MAARSLFRSVARRVLHGSRGFVPSPSSSARGFLPPPSSNEVLASIVAGMAAGAALRRSLARAPPVAPPQRVYQRRLFSSSSSSTSDSMLDAMAKARAGVAYVTIFGSLIYMHGWIIPRIKSLEKELKAQKNLNECLAEATEAVDRFQAMLNSSSSATDVSVQSSGKENGNSTKDVSGNRTMEEGQHPGNKNSTMDYDAEIARLKELEADLIKLRDSL